MDQIANIHPGEVLKEEFRNSGWGCKTTLLYHLEL